MFFQRKEDLDIDGKKYIVSNAALFDHFKCKELIIGIWDHVKKDSTDTLEVKTFNQWKKELSGKLKEWDKHYVKHAKNTNPELAQIHTAALQPLVNLMESNFNYYNFLRLKAMNPELPDFRHKALEEKFVEHFTKVCDILAAFPSREDDLKLETPYDILQMLNVMKTPNWQDVVPLNHYFEPLKKQFDKVTEVLLEMRRKGVLRCRYYIEENRDMQKGVCDLMKKDYRAQDLAGDPLKRDQFIFLYEVHQVVYQSALKDEYLKGALGGVIFQDVIPMLTVFRAMLRIRDINDTKKADTDKEKEKYDRREALGIAHPEPEEEKLDIPLTDAQKKLLKRGKKIEHDPEVIEEYRAKKAYEKELATYGVSIVINLFRPVNLTFVFCLAYLDLGEVFQC